jgi:choline dehydrogenase-like flavoprotein
MPANLPLLVEAPPQVDVQTTTFSIDALGRFVCSTWEEAVHNGGAPFDAVVIGAGMYGAYCAEKIYRFGASKGRRVLVLEAGSFLVSEHVQNLARIGLNVPGAIPPAADPGIARELVWGIPWRGQDDYPGLAYCIGGKSLYWGGWCPRLTEGDLQQWPSAAAQYLRDHYPIVEEEIGVSPATDFISGALFVEIERAFRQAAPMVADIELGLGTNGIQDAPLAVQGEPPASGLFSFDKYSSAPILVDAIREDVGQSGLQDSQRRLFLVPRAHVVKLHASNGVVHQVEVAINGQREFLQVGPSCAVILAVSAIESTRLALLSFPTPLMGRNLMAHVRSDFAVRIKRSAFQTLPAELETAAILVRGKAPNGRFHLQVTASNQAGGSDDLLFRMVPDLDFLNGILANQDPQWISITLRAIGEMHGSRVDAVPNETASWINLSPHENDEFGSARAWAHIKPDPGDLATWRAMDAAAIALAQRVAGSPDRIEYLYDGGWKSAPPPLDRPFPEWHRGLGTTYHEAGALWMGDDPAQSVTDAAGRFHHIQNAYACDQATFPTVGSVNPALTGLVLARRLAERIAA